MPAKRRRMIAGVLSAACAIGLVFIAGFVMERAERAVAPSLFDSGESHAAADEDRDQP